MNPSRDTTIGVNDKKEYKIIIKHLGGDEDTHAYKNVKVTLGFDRSPPAISNCSVRIREPPILKPNPVIGSQTLGTIPVVIDIEDLVGNTPDPDVIKEIDMEIETGVDPVSEESWDKTTPPNEYTLFAAIRYEEEIILNIQGKQIPIAVKVTDD